MKNICFLNGDMSRSGGTERVTAIIANELSKLTNKYRVHVLSVSNELGESFFPLEKNISKFRIFDSKNINFKKNYIATIMGIRKYIKKNNIDILIDVDVILDLFSIPATRFSKTKLISWEHFHFYQNAGIKLRDVSRRLSIRFSNYYITLTQKDLDNVRKNFKVKVPIDYMYNPLLKSFSHEYDKNSKIIMTAGAFWSIKGYDLLCEIANLVLHKHPDWKWFLYGEGEDGALIESKIIEYKLQGKLVIKGKVSNIDNCYEKAAIYVMTSRSEGLPMTLLEAQAHSLPIVSFDIMTGPSEIIEHHVNGFLTNSYDLKQMAQDISKLIEDDELRKKFSDHAKDNVNKFNLDTIVRKWSDILERV